MALILSLKLTELIFFNTQLKLNIFYETEEVLIIFEPIEEGDN
jgi:hypothetical protein